MPHQDRRRPYGPPIPLHRTYGSRIWRFNAGGFLALKGNGKSGVKPLWQGFAGVASFARDIETMRATHEL